MIGIDEVGRGAWAGPLLVVAGRATSALPEGLRDSKKLSKKRRQVFANQLLSCTEFGEGWVNNQEIDELGLTKAMRLGVARSLLQLNVGVEGLIIMDGAINYCAASYANVQCVVRADDTYPIVSAASIYAKVARDNYMSEQAIIHESYGFERHVGYGTAAHLAAIKVHGVSALHRLSFKPVASYASR